MSTTMTPADLDQVRALLSTIDLPLRRGSSSYESDLRLRAAAVDALLPRVPVMLAELDALAQHLKCACDQIEEEAASREQLLRAVRLLHDMVDQTDPDDPIGAALTRAGLERRP